MDLCREVAAALGSVQATVGPAKNKKAIGLMPHFTCQQCPSKADCNQVVDRVFEEGGAYHDEILVPYANAVAITYRVNAFEDFQRGGVVFFSPDGESWTLMRKRLSLDSSPYAAICAEGRFAVSLEDIAWHYFSDSYTVDELESLGDRLHAAAVKIVRTRCGDAGAATRP